MSLSGYSLSLAGKVAIITGSAKPTGIGGGIAMTLAHAGARVVINHVSDSSAEDAFSTAARIQASTNRPDSAIVVRADIGSPEGAKSLVDGALKGLGVEHIDIIVNNAVWAKPGLAISSSEESLHKTFAVGVFGPLYILQHAMSNTSNGGRVINIGSVASQLGFPGTGIYGASKAAMDALTFTLAQQLGRDGKGVTINTIMPGPVPTSGVPSDPQVQAAHERLKMLTRAENRLVSVHDIADVALFLASEKSRWITGQVISVSGGITGGQ